MNSIRGFGRVIERHSPIIWWLIRALEIVTCIAIIVNVVHHW